MAIPCPSCGREYDVTLFQFGRTIRCTCGARVGPEKRLRRTPEGRFLADAMLGRLARLLRALGYDTRYDPSIDDDVAVRSAMDEGRTLLTRDRRLREDWRVEGIVVLEREDPDGQLREVAERLGVRLREDALFTRCLRCNAPLEPIGPDEAVEHVPPRVFRAQDTFRRCPSCGRVYWDGTHTQRMRRRLERVLKTGPL